MSFRKRRQTVLVPIAKYADNDQRRKSDMVPLVRAPLLKAKPKVKIVYSHETIKVVENGASGFYSVHFDFLIPPTHPIIVSPMASTRNLRMYPSVIKFTPEKAHLPHYFRVSVMEDAENDPRVSISLDHSIQSIDPVFCGTNLIHEPSNVKVIMFQSGGKYLMSCGDSTYGELGQDTFESQFQFAEVSFHHLYQNNRLVEKHHQQPKLCESVHATLLSRIACGSHHAFVVDANGRLFSFGSSVHGQLGMECKRNSSKPQVWNGIDHDGRLHSKLMEVSCGGDHTMVITDDGEMLTCGNNDHGQLGYSSRNMDSLMVPKCVNSLNHKIAQIACGLKHSMVLLENGNVFTWGYGKSGALGHGNRENVATPHEVESLRGRSVYQVSCGDMHSAVVLNGGELLTTGWCENGRLGRVKASDDCSCSFDHVDLKGRLCSLVACGGSHTICLTENYDVFAFGANNFGQLGLGDCRDRHFPTEVLFFRKAKIHHLALGKFHSLAISDERMVYAWGNGEQGQCGLDSYPQLYTLPQLVRSLLGCPVSQIAAGDAFTILLCENTPTAVHELAGRDEHWKLRQQQLLESDNAHRDSIRKHINTKRQEKFHANLQHTYHGIDSTRGSLNSSNTRRCRSASSAHRNVNHFQAMLYQSPGLQRAILSASATQRPRSGLGCCIGSPKYNANAIMIAPRIQAPERKDLTPRHRKSKSPDVKAKWLLQQKSKRESTTKASENPPPYESIQSTVVRPASPPPDYASSLIYLLNRNIE